MQTAAQQQQLQYGEDVARLQRQSGLGQALAGLSGAQAGIGQQQAGLGISGYGGLAQAGRDYAGQLAGLGGQYGQIGQQIGSLAGQHGQLAGQFGAVAVQVGQLGGQQLGVGQALGQLAGQYGTGAGAMGQQAAGLAGLSQAFGGLGQQALGQGYREQGYLSGVGEQQRGMEQQRADLSYQQFVEEREFPSTQLQKYSSLIQGFPFQFSQTPQQPSSFQTAAGGIATLGGLGRGLGFFNKGGDIGKGTKYLQEGGIAGLSGYGIDDIKKYLMETRLTREEELEKIADQKRQAQASALLQAGAGIMQADPRAGGLAALIQGAGAAAPGLSELASIRQSEKGIGRKIRGADIEDALTIKKLEEYEADRAAALAKAKKDAIPDDPITPAIANSIRAAVAGKLDYVFDMDSQSFKKRDGTSLTKKQADEASQLFTDALEEVQRTGSYVEGSKLITAYGM